MATLGRAPTPAPVTGVAIEDGSVGTADLGNSAVTNAKLADDAVSSAKIQDSAVTSGKMGFSVLTPSYTGDVDLTGNMTVNGYIATSTLYTTNGFYADGDAISSSSGALTIPVSSANVFTLTLSENITSVTTSGTNASYVSAFLIRIAQDSGGSGYTIDWGSDFRWVGGVAPTLTATANSYDVLGFFNVGTVYYGFVVGQDLKAAA